MKVVTAAEMQEIDEKTIREPGISGLVLMERAGLAVVSKIKELFGRKKVIVVSGAGNNGGDGMVIARNLHNEGWNVEVFLTAMPEDLKGDALSQYKAALKCGVLIKPAEELIVHKASIFTRHSIIVDAILGTGLKKNIAGMLSEIINILNQSAFPVISVDIPSGISSDNGQVMGNAVRAGYTVTFGLPKRGHFLHPGAEFSGKLFIEDIGFPKALLGSEKPGVELLERDYLKRLIPVRRTYSHKGNYGHVLIIAGSRGKTGAALMAAEACLRTGAGLVTIGIPESLAEVFQSRVTEAMTLILPDNGDGTLSAKASGRILDFLRKSADILAIGPGIGVTAGTRKLLRDLISNSESPMVIDADGINSLNGNRGVFTKAKAPLILTPHPGEMARLLKEAKSKEHRAKSVEQKARSKDVAAVPKAFGISLRDEIEKDRINIAICFAKETGTHLVLKGVPTIIAAPDGQAFINPTGNPGMAKGGTGDVLTGMISGFLAVCRNPLYSCILGVYMHGLAGDIGASEIGENSLMATDIIDKIPAAFFSLKNNG
ncbi:MAG: NAD(P)H-hydrate dehydratase [Thermodesulfovibrionales bacterium]